MRSLQSLTRIRLTDRRVEEGGERGGKGGGGGLTVNQIFVRGISFKARPLDLVDFFESQCGTVTKIEGMFMGGKASGRAWVTFEDKSVLLILLLLLHPDPPPPSSSPFFLPQISSILPLPC